MVPVASCNMYMSSRLIPRPSVQIFLVALEKNPRLRDENLGGGLGTRLHEQQVHDVRETMNEMCIRSYPGAQCTEHLEMIEARSYNPPISNPEALSSLPTS